MNGTNCKMIVNDKLHVSNVYMFKNRIDICLIGAGYT